MTQKISIVSRERDEYGAEVIKNLSKDLTNIYGKGYSKRTLYQCLKVYRIFPQIVYEARAQFGLLSWTHYRILTQVEDSVARNWNKTSDKTKRISVSGGYR